MIRLDVKQRSPEWIAARIGIPTASQFHRILTTKGVLSAAHHGYMCELLAEQMLGASLDSYTSELMERGTELEGDAYAYYELQRDVDTQEVGFCLRDDRSAGCSPDRLIGDEGGLEIKCPGAPQHVSNMLGMAAKYNVQVQGCMWVTGARWWDLLSYHPDLPPALVRIERDAEFIAALAGAVASFNGVLRSARGQLEQFVRVADEVLL